MSSPSSSTSADTRLPMSVEDLEEHEESDEDPDDTGQRADALRGELARIAVEQALSRCRARRSSRRRSVPSAKRPSESTPQAPLTPWTAIAPTGSSIFSVRSTKSTATTTSTPAIAADDHRRHAVDEGARRGDRDQPGQHAVDHHAGIRLAELQPDEEHRATARRPCRPAWCWWRRRRCAGRRRPASSRG